MIFYAPISIHRFSKIPTGQNLHSLRRSELLLREKYTIILNKLKEKKRKCKELSPYTMLR